MKRRTSRRRIDPKTIHIIKQIGVGVLVISLLALLVYGIWYVTRTPALTITEVSVSGGETISHSAVEEQVRKQLEGAYLRLVPRTFAYTYPHDDIVSSLSDIERIKDIKIKRMSRTGLAISFDEHIPFALWCEEQEKSSCVFINDEGYAFSKAPELRGARFQRFEFIGRSPVKGEQFIEEDKFNNINTLLELLTDSGWYTTGAAVDAADDMYIYLAEGGELKATLHQTPAETMNNLATVLNAEEFSHITPDNFNYIDLRFGNKVFVNEVLEELATSTEEIAASTLQSEE